VVVVVVSESSPLETVLRDSLPESKEYSISDVIGSGSADSCKSSSTCGLMMGEPVKIARQHIHMLYMKPCYLLETNSVHQKRIIHILRKKDILPVTMHAVVLLKGD